MTDSFINRKSIHIKKDPYDTRKQSIWYLVHLHWINSKEGVSSTPTQKNHIRVLVEAIDVETMVYEEKSRTNLYQDIR